jgi:hypothetical protein
MQELVGHFRSARPRAIELGILKSSSPSFDQVTTKELANFRVVVKKRASGKSTGNLDAYVYIQGAAKDRGAKASALRSENDILKYFDAHRKTLLQILF